MLGDTARECPNVLLFAVIGTHRGVILTSIKTCPNTPIKDRKDGFALFFLLLMMVLLPSMLVRHIPDLSIVGCLRNDVRTERPLVIFTSPRPERTTTNESLLFLQSYDIIYTERTKKKQYAEVPKR